MKTSNTYSNFFPSKITYIVICGIMLGIFCLSCSTNHPTKDARQDFLDRGIDSLQASIIFNNASVFPDKTQLSIALLTDSTTIFVGLEKRNDTLVNVENRNANFEIGSVSMVFTSTLLANFVQNEKLALGDSISSYFPVSLMDSLQITFVQLANHTSGLPRVPTKMLLTSLFKMDNPYADFDDTKMATYLQGNVELESQPGSNYSYSNLGMGVLGYSLSQVGKEPFGKLLKDKVFKSYKLANTTTDRSEIKDSLIVGLNKAGKKTSNWDMAAMAGAGAVISSADDMSKFARAQFNPNDRILALTRKKTFTIDDTKSVGLGWNILLNKNGSTWLSQSGGTGGYSSSVVIDTLSHTAVIILSNVSASNEYKANIESLCYDLMRTIEPKAKLDEPLSEQ